MSEMRDRQKKKNVLEAFPKGTRERYKYTHCQNCGKKMNVARDKYFNEFGFCSVTCGMELYGLSESDFY
ncbi:hypothetical protein [Leuconostoc citreum]|uniref:hypothetical protein n=1 Tax=Leuconostoc citreum TaxID=33964 RepID=UPI0032DE65E6